MIVTVTCPVNTIEIRYGAISFLADADHQLQVPDYVAKSVVAMPGFSASEDLSGLDIAEAIAASEPYECNYILLAYNQQLGDVETRVERAGAVFGSRGSPSVSSL